MYDLLAPVSTNMSHSVSSNNFPFVYPNAVMGKCSLAFTSIFLVMPNCPKYIVLKSVSSSKLSVLITSAYTHSYTSKYSAFSLSGLPPKFTSAFSNSFFCTSLYRPISCL